ncbi:MAG TPA: type 1 glutamine amidotransferase [Ktedonobacteraceae bacterium]|nr:type 1 glutamine amidotransferase [Ktedonobacteraceae bacterium]
MKRVLALQHIWDDPPGYLGEIMQEYAIACDIVNVEEEAIPNLEGYAAIISLGGAQHAYDDVNYPYFVPEKALLRHVVERDIPFLGICLGGQLLASAMGATVERHSITELGFFEVQLTEEGKTDPLFQGLPDGYQQVFHWHEDIFDIPPGGVKLATGYHAPNQAFRIGKRAYGIQYHIELTPAMLDTWLHFPDYMKEIVKVSGQEALEEIERDRITRYPIFLEHSRIVFKNFLRMSGCS